MRTTLAKAALGGLLAALALPLQAQDAIELRMGSSSAKADQLSVSLDKLAELAAAKSNGKIAGRVFYQSLGVEHQLLQGAQAGTLDVGMISNGNAARYTNAYLPFDLPFLFKRYEDMLDFLGTPLGRQTIATFEKDTGLKHLYLISFGSGRDVQTRSRRLRVPDDIKGLKIRTISTPVEFAIYRAWGANPTPVDWGQTYTALQQGVVDGMQSNIGPVWSGKFDEVVKHNIRLNYTASFVQVYMNAKKFSALPEASRKALTDAARETETWTRKFSADQVESYLADLKKRGMEIYYPTAAEYAQWTAVREKVWRDVAEQQKGKIDIELANKILASQK
ncbi:MAG: TRAP transporter substrate-binding protein [Betaproteobacteria bacterium]